jgi:hypothetical protein
MPILITSDYDDVTHHVYHHGDDPRILEEITNHLDEDYHTVWLDGLTVWHAWKEPGEDDWHLDHERADHALDWIREQLDGHGVFDRIADPTRYSTPEEGRYLDSDEAVMAEFYDVELAAITGYVPDGADPRDVDRLIRARIDRARAEAARLASLRAHHIRRAFEGDGERGWKSTAARGLNITLVSLGDILKDDEARAERRRHASSLAVDE